MFLWDFRRPMFLFQLFQSATEPSLSADRPCLPPTGVPGVLERCFRASNRVFFGPQELETRAADGARQGGMGQDATIAAVDDEPEILATLAEYFDRRGLSIGVFDGAESFRAAFAESPTQIVLLDINLGAGEDGLSLARWVKDSSDAAVIMLTAAGDTVDRIVGLELGADDYIAKPFDLREVHARIKAVLRRRKGPSASAPEANAYADANANALVQLGGCTLDMEAHRLCGPDGADIPITSMEYDLLKTFVERPNRVLSRDQLLDLAHDREWDPYDRSIDIRVTRLRRKIEIDPSKPQVIKTVRGAGYVFVPPKG